MERNGQSLNEQVYQEAGGWFLAFRDEQPGLDLRRDFDLWMRRSPDHLAAYLEIAAVWGEVPNLQCADAETLIRSASQDVPNVVSLAPGPLISAPLVKKRPKWITSGALLKAASVLIVCGCTATLFWATYRSTYSTGVGEQQAITLDDGSTVELNSKSKLRVRYSKNMRSIELLKGQALFTVEKDAKRPFVVNSGDVYVRAVGTQFDVYRKRTATVVTVVEGQVSVRDIQQSARAYRFQESAQAASLVVAGQQIVASEAKIDRPVLANVGNATAWTRRQLAFDGTTLSEIADEFNRYNERQLIVADPSLAGFRVSGVFSSSNPKGLLHFLRDRADISVRETSSQIIIEWSKDRRTEKY